jgi:hypothetical protein
VALRRTLTGGSVGIPALDREEKGDLLLTDTVKRQGDA